MGDTEITVGQIVDKLMDIRDNLLVGMSSSTNDSDRATLKIAIDSSYQEILSLANTKTINGFMFSGFSNVMPFTQTSGAGVYAGDSGVRTLPVSDTNTVAISKPGSEVFRTGTADDVFQLISERKWTTFEGELRRWRTTYWMLVRVSSLRPLSQHAVDKKAERWN